MRKRKVLLLSSLIIGFYDVVQKPDDTNDIDSIPAEDRSASKTNDGLRLEYLDTCLKTAILFRNLNGISKIDVGDMNTTLVACIN